MPIRLFALLIGGLLVASAASAAPAPHQATYQMVFNSMTLPGAVQSAGGATAIKFEDTCDGWATHTRIGFQLTTSEGQQIQVQTGIASWESKDGLRYRFFSQTKFNNQVVSESQGEASLDGPGKGGRAVYSRPGAKSIMLAPGTAFPIQASLRTVAAVKAGRKQIQWTVFDGITNDGVYLTNDVVIGVPAPLKTRPRGDVGLLQGKAWRIRSAYFDPANSMGTPFGEMTYDGFENLVATRMLMDMGVIKATAELTEIRALPTPAC